jgi:signal transduction histidine kinase
MFATDGYTSPFFTFFVFLVLSAAVRWGWRATAATAATVFLLYVAAGISSNTWGTEAFDIRRFLIRTSYLLALSVILVWVGGRQRELGWNDRAQFPLHGLGDSGELLIEKVLRSLREEFGARKAVAVWWEAEEPWTTISILEGEVCSAQRVSVDLELFVDPQFHDTPMLLDHLRRRVLLWSGGRRRMLSDRQVVAADLAGQLGLRQALVIPVPEQQYGAVFFVSGIPGLCSDDLRLAAHLRDEVSSIFERVTLMKVTDEAAASRTRLSLARDLHDSIVQFLAGLGFRLENLRRAIEEGRDVNGEIDSLKAELIREQRDLRKTLEVLRGGRGPNRVSNLSESLRVLTESAARQWGVTCAFTTAPSKIEVRAEVEHHVLQLLREAFANAVRHGRADAISVALRKPGHELLLEIGDNGSGFPMGTEDEIPSSARKMRPWSLHERVQELGGDLMLVTGEKGTRVSISLPLEDVT